VLCLRSLESACWSTSNILLEGGGRREMSEGCNLWTEVDIPGIFTVKSDISSKLVENSSL
jgi:hypothetical protein